MQARRMRKYTLRFESICFFLDIGRPATAADFLETYWFSSLLHTDVATVCENRTIYTDFVKASYSFCSSRLNQLFKWPWSGQNGFNMNIWKTKLLMVLFNCISISGWLSVKHTSTLVNSGSQLSRTIQRQAEAELGQAQPKLRLRLSINDF